MTHLDRLSELRAATLRRVASLEGAFEAIVEASTDVATDDEHDPEGHTIAWERQQVSALADENVVMLANIDAAEQRIADGTYGICTECEVEIAAERLDVLPATPTCRSCAR